jgi:hypothetical protein
MRHTRGIARCRLVGIALAPLLSACQSPPATEHSLSPTSSMLAVEVLFPVPLGRDPDLVQAYLVRGPIHGGPEELPELVPATFVKNSRAYLLDPEPGTYSLVAVTSAVAAPASVDPVAGGVDSVTLGGTISDAVVFPAELIERTRTTVGPGDVAFVGTLRVAPAERINANAVPKDEFQSRVAERLRPGAATSAGLAGWFTRAWTVDLEKTSLSRSADDRESFFRTALKDLEPSPWAQVVAREAPGEAPAARSQPPRPAREQAAEGLASTPASALASTEPAAPEAEASPPRPERRRVPGLPPESPLAGVELGMSYHEVHRMLGAPDDTIDRVTGKAWIPFYSGPGAYLRDWIYAGEGRVVFSRHLRSLEVIDVIYDPNAGK